MAYKDANGFDHATGEAQVGAQSSDTQTLQITGESVDLPSESFVRDADFSRDGADLVLNGPDGTIIVDSYFSGEQSPTLISPNGATLTPELVNSFTSSGDQYAQNASMSDVSPIGIIQEISGDATITRNSGVTEELSIGSPVYQGDVVETNTGSAVNITFSDESSFAVSEDTRLAIDEYVFDPASQGGVQNFSVLKGVFVYTSGLIGRDDPDDVSIDTPVGSIGIRGTIIAGDVNEGEITVIEGAIVLRDPSGAEMTLASQFETGRFTSGNGIENMGQKSASNMAEKFSIVSNVAPNLFSSINDVAAENAAEAQDTPPAQAPASETPADSQTFDADGTTDQNGDSEIDGTVDEGSTTEGEATGDGATLNQNTDTDIQNAETDTPAQPQQNMNPMAMQIAKAMGMMDGNDAPMGDNTMGKMAMMAMSADQTMTGAETIMEAIMDAKSARMAGKKLRALRAYLNDLNDLNPDIDPSIISTTEAGSAPEAFKNNPNALNFASVAPDAFFASGEGYDWSYKFSHEFDSSATSYELSSTTHSELTNLEISGVIKAGGINFDASNGNLTLDFADDFASNITDGATQLLNIEVSASNAHGTSELATYDFNIFNDSTTFSTLISPTNDAVYNSTGDTDDTVLVGVTNAVTNKVDIFLGAGDDTASIGANGFVVQNTTTNLGNGTNTATIEKYATNNTIIGGDGKDTFNIGDASAPNIGGVENHFHGMGNDDIFKVNITDSGLYVDARYKLENNITGILIDGGTSGFRALNDIKGNASGMQRGDALILEGDGAIDFTAINDDFIKSMERLELGSGDQTVTLGYDDVIAMTDDRNTLLINTDSGSDSVNFSDFTGKGFTQRTETLDDTVDHAGATLTNFDVFENGTVTLIVEQGLVATPNQIVA